MRLIPLLFLFFTATATTQIYPLSLHDALPICRPSASERAAVGYQPVGMNPRTSLRSPETSTTAKDRKSTRLNSSHSSISYAVFCLKKKIETITTKLLLNHPEAQALHDTPPADR